MNNGKLKWTKTVQTGIRRNLLLPSLVSLLAICSHAQNPVLSLDACYQLARANYPAIQKLELIAKTSQYTIENTHKRYLPQVSFSGQASYQSQTISFPDVLGSVAGVALPQISKDQYRVQGDIDQLIYDGGGIRDQRALAKNNEALQQQSLEVNLYALRQRINTIYFSILLIDRQLAQNGINRANLQGELEKAQAALKNGTSFKSNVDELAAEMINVDMIATEYSANRIAFLEMLSLFIGKHIASTTQLVLPEPNSSDATAVNRPELKGFELQKAVFDIQQRQLKTALQPRINAFFQGAYGRPTLSIIENKSGAWFITGLRFNWSLGSLYGLRNQQAILNLNRQSVDIDKQTFLFNTKLDLSQEAQQIVMYKELIEQDKKAIALRQSIKKSAAAQLANGVITTHDYITQSNAENLAAQQFILHQIQLLQAEYNLRFTAGN